MKHSRILVAAAFASCLGLPVAVHAQSGTSNYGIFGGGTNLSGGMGSSGSRQQGLGSNPALGSFGRSNLTALGGGNTVSPYLNLLNSGNTAINYYALVRPQVRQDSINTQVGSSIQQNDRLLSEQQQRERMRQQPYDPYAAGADLPPAGRTPAPAQTEPPQRTSKTTDTSSRDWAGSAKDDDFASAGQPADYKQRLAAQRRAKELKALEDELSGPLDTTPSTNQPARPSTPQANYAPVNPNSLRPANHYFPSGTGSLVNRPNNTPRQ